MRRGHILQVVLLGLLFGGITAAVAVVFKWLPDDASTQAHRIFHLYWIETIISIVIFALVMSTLVFAVLRFRAKPGDEEDGPPIHGNTKLEVIWTAIPTAIVVFIAVISSIILIQNGRAGQNPLKVGVVGEQFAWTFVYDDGKGGKFSTGEMVLPVNRTVKLYEESRDVIHSFWVPEFAQKQDMLPGEVKTLVITPTKLSPADGYPVICTELCGLGHGAMRSRVRVVSQADYDTWFAEHAKGQAAGGTTGGGTTGGGATSGGGATAGLAAGKQVFTSAGCMACHTLKDAGATATVGPNLDDLKPSKDRVVKQVENGGAAMPPFKGQLSAVQIDAVATYVSSVAGKG